MSADEVRKVRLSNKLCPIDGLMTPFLTMTPYYQLGNIKNKRYLLKNANPDRIELLTPVWLCFSGAPNGYNMVVVALFIQL